MEFKLCKKGLPLSLLETYSAFANIDGGIIILGVEESKQGNIIKGVDHAEVNTLIHANYYGRRGIVIVQDLQQITFTNPGSL